jgi:arylsulfatase A-like enzyme
VALERHGLEEDTLVVFFSDNGATANGSNGELRGTKGTVFEGGHRVSAIARWTGRIEAGSETDQLAMGFDLMPTMLDLAGAKRPGRQLDGVSLAPVLLRREKLVREPLFWQHNDAFAMRDGRWKLITGQQGLEGDGLFDLSADPSEQNNLARNNQDRVRKMRAAIKEWIAETAATATSQPSSR